MKNILITGSNGFIGKNLKNKLLKLNDINIYEFNRGDKISDIKRYIKDIDFIFHLAGEVRPDSSDDEFKTSHGILTQSIVDLIEKDNLKIPILLASSKHAQNPKNMYGQTKKDTEDIIINYSKRNDISVYIYRLSHLFGEDCKPNYNSVISTWIYNSINDLDINIFDRKIPMVYLYVQDVVDSFIEKIYLNNDHNIHWCNIDQYYETTLGEVVDFINEFKKNINNSNYSISNKNSFKEKLFNVYLDYYNKKD
jgi:UDP-2-acetamido-2,6-beta-L-arabino-hexul-4-ose reductase